MGCVRGNTRGHRIAAAVKPLMAGGVGAWLLSSTPALLADTNWIGPDGGSWFQDASPNDWSLTGGLVNPGGNPAIGNGAGVIDTSAGGNGVIYDPVNDPLNPNPSVTNYSYTQLYIDHGTSTVTQQSSKLTLKSGTLTISGNTIVGRYGNDNISGSGPAVAPTGYLVINGGALVSQSSDLDVANNGGTVTAGDVNANGVLIFDSGSLTAKVLRTGVSSNVSGAATGTFINSGKGLGGISLTGFQPGAGASGVGGSGALEIDDGTNGVTLISVAGPTKIGDVSAGTDLSTSTFNFVLDAAPAMTLNVDPTLTDYVPANVDLINSTAITGYFTSVEGISGLTGETPMPTVTTSFGGHSYTWALDYTAVVSGGNVTATTGGTDVVLLGEDSTVAVPEPASIGLLALGSLALLKRRRTA